MHLRVILCSSYTLTKFHNFPSCGNMISHTQANVERGKWKVESGKCKVLHVRIYVFRGFSTRAVFIQSKAAKKIKK